MRPTTLLAAAGSAITLLLGAAAPAGAAVPYTVQPGQTLWGLAAANGFTTRSFAAANGLAPDAPIVAGTTLDIPTVAEAAAALASAGVTPSASATVADAPSALGGYIVRPGDTLSGLAARSGVTVAQMAAANGLDPAAPLLAGSALKLPTGSPVPAAPAGAEPSVVTPVDPAPSAGRVSAADIAAVAARNGVPPSLAQAIAWQESGFNNGVVSSANARGVMQVLPGTWDYVQENLALRQLDPNSAIDNVGAGVLYLGRLLRETGGDQRLAAAGYYQGLSSVRRIGLYDDTERYVDNVQALQARFGG